MIVEERCYTAQVGRVKEWVDYYEKHAFPIQQKYLGKCIGFFTTEIGTLHQIVHIWAYDSLAHRETARANMMQGSRVAEVRRRATQSAGQSGNADHEPDRVLAAQII